LVAGWAAVAVGGSAGAGALYAQSSTDQFGSARASGLGYATTALVGDAGIHVNPALRAYHSRPVAVVYARQSFGLAELRYGAAHLAVPIVTPGPERGPVSRIVASGGAGTFGFADYREVHLNAGAAAGLRLGTTRAVHVGLNLRYHHIRIASYGGGGGLAVNVGLAVAVLPSLSFGTHALNVFGASLQDDVPLPQTLAIGVGYTASEAVRVVVDAAKDLDFPLSVRGGLEVRPVAVFALRAGVASAPTRFTGGAGVRVGPIDADLAAEQHPELGWSPSMGAVVRW
jgi:hypothetical protein